MNRNENNGQNNNIPENDPSKAMNSKQDVDKSNDEKTDQDFPGYPHYPAKEDIMDKRTDLHQVDVDVEKLAGGANASGLNERFAKKSDDSTQDGEALKVSGGTNDEIGTPQNVEIKDTREKNSGTDLNEAAGDA